MWSRTTRLAPGVRRDGTTSNDLARSGILEIPPGHWKNFRPSEPDGIRKCGPGPHPSEQPVAPTGPLADAESAIGRSGEWAKLIASPVLIMWSRTTSPKTENAPPSGQRVTQCLDLQRPSRPVKPPGKHTSGPLLGKACLNFYSATTSISSSSDNRTSSTRIPFSKLTRMDFGLEASWSVRRRPIAPPCLQMMAAPLPA